MANLTPTNRFVNLNSANPTIATTTPATFNRKQRETLTASEHLKVADMATKPLPSLFTLDASGLGQNEVNTQFLQSNFLFTSQTETFKVQLQAFSMTDIFDIYPLDVTGAVNTTAQPLDLIEESVSVNFDAVKANNKLSFEYGDDITRENLTWTEQLIVNSCDQELADRVIGRLQMIESSERGGPAAFHILAQLIITNTEDLSFSIVKYLRDLKLTNFDGEDVYKMATVVDGAAKRLRAANYQASEMAPLALKIL